MFAAFTLATSICSLDLKGPCTFRKRPREEDARSEAVSRPGPTRTYGNPVKSIEKRC